MSVSDPTGPVRYLRWVAFGAAAALTASGEYSLAHLVGWPWYVAWLLPVACDVYAYASFATRRRADTLAALALMIATNGAYHLAATGNIPVDWRLVVLVASLPPAICWRVHRLGERPEAQAPEVPAERPVVVPPVPVEVVPRAEVPPARKLRSVPAEQKRAEVTASVRKRRPAEVTRKLAEEIMADAPELTKKAVAAKLGISDRYLRDVLAAV